jgi:calcium-dependent protein kinase
MLDSKESNAQKNEGTVYFMAPECCGEGDQSKNYVGKPLDIWAFAVTVYIMTFKTFPFKAKESDDVLELLDLIANAEYILMFNIRVKFPETRSISDEFKSLLISMFEKDPNKRATTEDIMRHPWTNLNRKKLEKKKYRLFLNTLGLT